MTEDQLCCRCQEVGHQLVSPSGLGSRQATCRISTGKRDSLSEQRLNSINLPQRNKPSLEVGKLHELHTNRSMKALEGTDLFHGYSASSL